MSEMAGRRLSLEPVERLVVHEEVPAARFVLKFLDTVDEFPVVVEETVLRRKVSFHKG